MPETAEINEEEAYIIISDIREDLDNINDSINSLDSNVIDIRDRYLYDEQTAEKVIKEDEKKEKSESSDEDTKREIEEQTEDYTEIIESIQETNKLLENQNTLITVNVFTQGIIIGVLLLTIFWKRFVK